MSKYNDDKSRTNLAGAIILSILIFVSLILIY